MVMHLDHSICGLNLKTGSLIIGVLFALETFCSLVTYSSKADSVSTDYKAEDTKEVKGILVYSAALNAFMLVTNVLLILGGIQERASYLFPWVIIYTVLASLKALGYFIMAIIFFVVAQVGLGILVIIIGSISICLYAYCILIVFSYYRTLNGTAPGTV